MYSELYTLGEKVQFFKEVYKHSPVYVKGPKSFRYFFWTEARTDQKGPEECTQNLKKYNLDFELNNAITSTYKICLCQMMNIEHCDIVYE